MATATAQKRRQRPRAPKRKGFNLPALLHLPPDFLIVDAAEDFALTVKEGDRRLGVANHPDACAFSVACRRANGNVIRTEFFKTMAYLVYEDRAIRYVLSTQARKQIALYDQALGFAPGVYWLRMPKGRDRLGQGHHGSGTPRSGVGGPKSRQMTYIRGRSVG